VIRPKMLLAVGLLVLVATSLGCFKMDLQVTLKPDLGMDVGMQMVMPLKMGAQMEAPDLKDMGGMENVKVQETDKERIISGSRALGPDEQLGAEEEAQMEMMRQKVPHRLSTYYVFVMELPAGEGEGAKEPPSGEGAADDEESAAAMEAMMEGMLSSFKFDLTVHMPGRIVSTSGTRVDDNTVRFSLTMQDLNSDTRPRLTAISRLPNYTNLGRLSDQMIAAGGEYFTAARMVEYLNCGLLPDPPTEIDAKDKLGTADYAALAELIAVLDDQLAPGLTEAVIAKLGLNKDRVEPSRIRKAREAVRDADLRTLAVDAVLKALQ